MAFMYEDSKWKMDKIKLFGSPSGESFHEEWSSVNENTYNFKIEHDKSLPRTG